MLSIVVIGFVVLVDLRFCRRRGLRHRQSIAWLNSKRSVIFGDSLCGTAAHLIVGQAESTDSSGIGNRPLNNKYYDGTHNSNQNCVFSIIFQSDYRLLHTFGCQMPIGNSLLTPFLTPHGHVDRRCGRCRSNKWTWFSSSLFFFRSSAARTSERLVDAQWLDSQFRFDNCVRRSEGTDLRFGTRKNWLVWFRCSRNVIWMTLVALRRTNPVGKIAENCLALHRSARR